MRGHARYPVENHFYTERERLENKYQTQHDVQIPSLEETAAFLGDPPNLLDLPAWLIKVEEKKEKLEGFYSQIPHELLCDPKIPSAAKVVFALFHKYSKPKDLSKNPTTFVGKNTIARHMGKTPRYISELIKRLEESGWISIIPRKGITNKTILHGKPNGIGTQEL
jgi:hypothetical protein